MVLLGNEAQLEARFSPLQKSVILMKDRCTICTERAMASEIVWTHPMELLGDVGQVEARFGPFGDSAILDAR